jgi:hypothetical protein
MQTLPATRLITLLAELRELPDGLATPVSAGLLVVDTMRALGHADVDRDAAVRPDGQRPLEHEWRAVLGD